jgi:uncharacterized SAM-binding protein YcdF (DUF218 family)
MRGLAALLVLALIWAAGLLAFAGRVQHSTPAPMPERADGAVALTGARSDERIGAAVHLLEIGKARRVLVSGVNRQTTREDVRAMARTARRLYDCCVDLGFEAATTLGNARETAAWAKARGYDSLIVVTADYHMPRAMLELRSAMPQTVLQAYPIATSVVDAKLWWRKGSTARLMVGEYSKYLTILGREAILRLGPKDAPKDAPEKKDQP